MNETYLNEKEIAENTVIMVEIIDKIPRPYLVWKKEVQDNCSTAICGQFLDFIINAPHIFPLRDSISMKLYFDPMNHGVKGYNKISEKEKIMLVKKIEPIRNLSELVKIIQNS